VISRLVKEPHFLPEVMTIAPVLAIAAFDLSAAFTDAGTSNLPITVIGIVLNLIWCLRRHPQEEAALCTVAFQRAMAALDSGVLAQLLDVFTLTVFYAPVFMPEFWCAFEATEALITTPLIATASAFLVRNLMMRDPERVRVEFTRFLGSGWCILELAHELPFDPIAAFNTALFTITEPGAVPAGYLALLCGVVPVHSDVSTHLCAYDISFVDQFLLALMCSDPVIPVYHLSGLVTAWFELADDLLCACATALMGLVIEEERLATQLVPVLEAGGELFMSKEDSGREDCESYRHSVQARLIPVVTHERAFQIFCQFLRDFIVTASDLSQQIVESLQILETRRSD
jgi:hypothetical protein